MKKDALIKAQATKKANAEKFKNQTIQIDDRWRIIRSDELNWEIQRKTELGWKFQGFYGSVISAFDSLPAKMLGEVAKNDVATVISNQKAIQETLEKALQFKMA